MSETHTNQESSSDSSGIGNGNHDFLIVGIGTSAIDPASRPSEPEIAESEVSQSEEDLKLVMDSISDYAILTADTKGIITGWNTGAANIFGYSAEEAIGQSTAIIFTPEDRAAGIVESEMQEVFKYGSAIDERWHIRKDGSRFFCSGIVNRMKESRKGFVKIARDMTSNKILEQQKDEFIGIASHELKTPVTSIKAYTEILQDVLAELETKVPLELINKLNIQVDRLTNLINDLLDTTKITEGQLALKKERLDINSLLNECRDNFRLLTSKHRLIVDAENIPVVLADRERILQVLTNLLSNAIKYSPEGGEIIISSKKLDQGVQISVKDFGIGMSAESQNRLFQRFFRSGNPVINTFPGIGLGLYISNEIIKRHGGTILVHSMEGEGSVFYVRLPFSNE